LRVVVILMCCLFSMGDTAYQPALPGYHYQFPKDHFAHPGFRTEWWYYTGNVWAKDGRRFGFEVVFFRQGERASGPQNPSVWAVHDVYLAHVALTDVRGKHFWFHERLNRAGPGIAGIREDQKRVWNGNWSAQWRDGVQSLQAVTPEFRLDLQLKSQTPPVIHGVNGVSQKAEGAGHASHYVSLPLLSTSGKVIMGHDTLEVAGTAWMDHEWFTEQLAANQVGWDWFSVQLADRSELMLFELRRRDGSLDPNSSGTFIASNGEPTHLRAADFTLKPVAWWGKYPVEWQIAVPSRKLVLRCSAVLKNQELSEYWEGAVDYSGTQKGVGYLEMTGYKKPVNFDR
jgi:predicted secreted hydrolase